MLIQDLMDEIIDKKYPINKIKFEIISNCIIILL